MVFELKNNARENINTLVRQLGYKPLGYTDKSELNCVRPLAGDYPRFHIYLKEEKDTIRFSIHLDQKKPSYEGSTAHSGDYDSEIVTEEARRIQTILASSKPARKNPFSII